MTHCRQQVFQFQAVKSRKVTVDFNGGYLSSDGGGLFLREVERKHPIISKLTQCFEDNRDPRYVEHLLMELLAQRLNGIALDMKMSMTTTAYVVNRRMLCL